MVIVAISTALSPVEAVLLNGLGKALLIVATLASRKSSSAVIAASTSALTQGIAIS